MPARGMTEGSLRRGRSAAGVVALILLISPGLAAAAWSGITRLSTRSPRGDVASYATVGVDEHGDDLAVWAQQNGSGGKDSSTPTRILMATRRSGHATWSTPKRLSPLDVSGQYPVVSVVPSGRAVAAWVASPLHQSRLPVIQAAVRSSSGKWSPPVDISHGGEVATTPAVGADRRGDAVVAWVTGPAHGHFTRVEAATFQVSSRRWSGVTVLARSKGWLTAPRVAVGPGGEAIVVWRNIPKGASYYKGNDVIAEIGAARARTVGHSWQRVPRMGREIEPAGEGFLRFELPGPQVAINREGDALVVWQGGQGQHIVIHASAWIAAVGKWQRQKNVSHGFGLWPHVAYGPRRKFAVIWITGHGQIATASKNILSCCWTRPTILSQGSGASTLPSYPKISLGPNGQTIAAWSARDSIDLVTRTGGARRWPAPKQVGGKNAELSGIAANTHGSAAIVWVQPGQAHNDRPDDYIEAAVYRRH